VVKKKKKILRQPSLLFSVLLSSGPFLGDWVPFEIRVLSDLRWAGWDLSVFLTWLGEKRKRKKKKNEEKK